MGGKESRFVHSDVESPGAGARWFEGQLARDSLATFSLCACIQCFTSTFVCHEVCQREEGFGELPGAKPKHNI